MPAVLNYFGLPGRAEATRIALAMAGVDYEDRILSFEDFGASSFKALPVYQMDGTDYTQSTALLRYAGKLSGTYPEDALAALKVDEIVMMLEDVFINIFSTRMEQDEEKRIHGVVAMVQTGFLIGIPTTMVEDVSPSLKAIDDAVMDHPKVSSWVRLTVVASHSKSNGMCHGHNHSMCRGSAIAGINPC
eukprot:jgi/Undpi1/7693/HiC_scaffold_23.g10166.m1